MIAVLFPPRSDLSNCHDLQPMAVPRSPQLRCVVDQANLAALEEPGKYRPPLEHDVYSEGDIVAPDSILRTSRGRARNVASPGGTVG